MSRGIYDKVNKVRIPTCGNEEFDVDNSLSSNSQNAVENRIINAEFNKTFRDTDASETSLADTDTFPFYDTSAAEKKKTTLRNIKDSVLDSGWSISGETATWHPSGN